MTAVVNATGIAAGSSAGERGEQAGGQADGRIERVRNLVPFQLHRRPLTV